MLKKSALLLLASLLSGCFALSPEVHEPAPESELQKVTARFDEVNDPGNIQCSSYSIKCHAQAPNMQLKIQMETYADLAKKRFCTVVTVPGMPKQVELYDGRRGYSIIQGVQTKVLTGDKAAFMRYSARYDKPWERLSGRYEKMMLDKNSHIINGKKCYRLVAQPLGEPTLMPVELFIDQATFHPVRSRSIVPTDLGKIPYQVDYIKFRKYEGALVSQTVQIQQLNMTLRAEVQELKVNCTIPDDIFDAEKIADEED